MFAHKTQREGTRDSRLGTREGKVVENLGLTKSLSMTINENQ